MAGHHSNDSNGRLIDLTKQEDVNLIKNVASKVDVLVDYLHEKRLETVGLIPEDILKINSRLVLARISGFGSVSGQFGGDATFAVMSGAMTSDRRPEDLDTILREAHGKSILLLNTYLISECFSTNTCRPITYNHRSHYGSLRARTFGKRPNTRV